MATWPRFLIWPIAAGCGRGGWLKANAGSPTFPLALKITLRVPFAFTILALLLRRSPHPAACYQRESFTDSVWSIVAVCGREVWLKANAGTLTFPIDSDVSP